MFDEMVTLLKQGEIVQPDLLRKRFDRALIKKLGVIKTPYSFWPADKKINPSSKELLWAAILLEDKENFNIVEAIISTVFEERQRAKGQAVTLQDIALQAQQLQEDYIKEFIGFAPSDKFKKKLQKKLQAVM